MAHRDTFWDAGVFSDTSLFTALPTLPCMHAGWEQSCLLMCSQGGWELSLQKQPEHEQAPRLMQSLLDREYDPGHRLSQKRSWAGREQGGGVPLGK